MKPYQRSTSVKRIVRKVSKGTSVRFKRRNKVKHKDAFGNPVKKGVSRPFSGFLAHNILERILRYANRVKKGVLSIDKIPIRFRSIVNKLVSK